MFLTQSSTKTGFLCAFITVAFSSGLLSNSHTGELMDVSIMSIKSSALTILCSGTSISKVPTPLWLCEAKVTVSNTFCVVSSSKNSNNFVLSDSRTDSCAHGQTVIPMTSAPTLFLISILLSSVL